MKPTQQVTSSSAPKRKKRERKPHIDRTAAVTQYYSFIRQIARRMARRLPDHVSLDDMISAGAVGLMDGIYKFDPKKSANFKVYAEYRIRGTILDELRAADHLSRDQRAEVNAWQRARQKLEGQHGRAPEPEEMAAEMGFDLESYYAFVAQFPTTKVVALRDDSDVSDPELSARSFDRTQQQTVLQNVISKLPVRLRAVVTMYYFEDLNLKEIGRILGVTESRICQLHREAMRQLRDLMK